MEGNSEFKTGECVILTQEFNGKTYYLYDGERYFSKGTKRLHRVVWEFYNGRIPKGYHVHHVNGITTDNRIENLNLISETLHLRFEGKKRFKNNDEWVKEFQEKGIESAKEWHKSKEGIEWHKKHAKDKMFGKWDLPNTNCVQCNSIFKPKAHHNKFCSNNCKSKYRRSTGIDNIQRKCECCKNEFTINKYTRTQTCSDKCRRELGRRSI
jgi:hypothetical protein